MKLNNIFLFICLLPQFVQAQSSLLLPDDKYYSDYMESHYPNLEFSYKSATQTFDYSGNWDFDGDGKKDSLFFVGNKGAHVYYHLVLHLSSEERSRDFTDFMEIDDPLLMDDSALENRDKEPVSYPQFVVGDFNSDSRADIYININNGFAAIPPVWKKRGAMSLELTIICGNKHLEIKDYEPTVPRKDSGGGDKSSGTEHVQSKL